MDEFGLVLNLKFNFCTTSFTKQNYKNNNCFVFFPKLLVDTFGGYYNIVINYNNVKCVVIKPVKQELIGHVDHSADFLQNSETNTNSYLLVSHPDR